MGLGLSHFARRFLTNEDDVKRQFVSPVLVWEAPPTQKQEQYLLGTQTGALHEKPRAGEPLVFELKKGDRKQNAFPMGVTVGRTDNNDIQIEDNSISRFHAFFQQDLHTHAWKLVDAESKNGTWIGPLKLVPKKPQGVTDHDRLRFGDIEMVFMAPESFFTYLKGLMSG